MIYIVDDKFHIITADVHSKELWQDTLCGVKIQPNRQSAKWLWCKKCLKASRKSGKPGTVAKKPTVPVLVPTIITQRFAPTIPYQIRENELVSCVESELS